MHEIDPAKRSFNKEFCGVLADSIRRDGLLHPPIVIDNGDGTYSVKSGRNRVYACGEVLGSTTVSCFVLEPGEDDLAEAIEHAANLWVNPLTKPQFRLALQRWRNIYMDYRKEKQTTMRGTKRKKTEFPKEIAVVLDVSKSKAVRLANTAEFVSPDNLATLDSAGVTATCLDKIGELRDADAVATAVKVISSGQDAEEAIRQGKKVKAEKKSVNGIAVTGDTKPASPKTADLTDDEWLETHCGKILSVLPFKIAFKRDAILYRRASEKDNLAKFRTTMKKAIAEAKKPGENGRCYHYFYSITRMSHPMHWLICDGCYGHGHVPDNKTESCKKCYGAGYTVTFE